MRVRFAVLVSIVFIAASQASAQDARAFWKDVLRKCAVNDVVGNDVLYLGPSNNVGLGAIWRKSGSSWRVVRMFDDSVAPSSNRAKTFTPGTVTLCKGNSASTTTLNASLILQALLAPLTGNIGADFKRARQVSVTVDGWAWDQLLEGDFNDLVTELPAQHGYRRDIRNKTVAGRALRVRNIEADLDFGKDIGAQLNAKYKGAIGELGGTFKGEWKNDGVLHLSSDGSSALAIELWKYKEGGFAAAGDRVFEKVPVGPGEKAKK